MLCFDPAMHGTGAQHENQKASWGTASQLSTPVPAWDGRTTCKPKGQQSRMSTLTRGHSLPLRLTIPPLRTLQGFACSVASLSRCPYHYPPGHHNLRCAALVECPLGQGEPSTRPEGHDESTYTSLTSFHSDDRKAWPLPADKKWFPILFLHRVSVILDQCCCIATGLLHFCFTFSSDGVSHWIPFGDHPLKLERSRED